MIRLMKMALIGFLIAGSLTACGRKSAPEFPENAKYPQQYPNN